jgi:murein DD-endopeptidase MepM/ murein hydrolase activator NlpD|tara:strand:+ start:168 stop:1511 length:1344 start_codon:yes stop_codon:yes gene_type:complete
MAIIDYFNKLKLNKFGVKDDQNNLIIVKKYYLHFLAFIFLSIFYFFISNQIENFNKMKRENFDNFIDEQDLVNLNKYFFKNIKSPYREYNYTIKNNDSIEKILNQFQVEKDEIKSIVYGLKEKKLSNIYAGRKINIVLKESKNNMSEVVNLLFPVSNTLSVEIRKNANNFSIKENIIRLKKKKVVVKNEIKTSLYSAAIEVGIEPNIIIEFARIYGFEIDFQRDIRKNDWFEVYYEKFIDENGVVKDTGKIIYASMFVNNKELNLYHYKHENDIGYYDLNGRSIVKSLMKTPINGARLSSSYGMRKHPILGYNKMHKGTDFAAVSGTPIMASGSGTITRARWCGGGGNCIKIKHNSVYETIYAHMKNFAKGVKEGKKVRQGQIIGYVGSTGMSTGPHLHYEVVVNGKKVNSQKLKLPSGKILKGNLRKNFEIERIKIDLQLSELRGN